MNYSFDDKKCEIRLADGKTVAIRDINLFSDIGEEVTEHGARIVYLLSEAFLKSLREKVGKASSELARKFAVALHYDSNMSDEDVPAMMTAILNDELGLTEDGGLENLLSHVEDRVNRLSDQRKESDLIIKAAPAPAL